MDGMGKSSWPKAHPKMPIAPDTSFLHFDLLSIDGDINGVHGISLCPVTGSKEICGEWVFLEISPKDENIVYIPLKMASTNDGNDETDIKLNMKVLDYNKVEIFHKQIDLSSVDRMLFHQRVVDFDAAVGDAATMNGGKSSGSARKLQAKVFITFIKPYTGVARAHAHGAVILAKQVFPTPRLLVGHRGDGADGENPEIGDKVLENTMKSFRDAHARSADMIEFDVHLSRRLSAAGVPQLPCVGQGHSPCYPTLYNRCPSAA